MATTRSINNLPQGFVLEGNDNQQPASSSNGGNLPQGFEVESNQPPQRNMVANVVPPLAGAAALGGLGAAAYATKQYVTTPNRLIKPIDAQLEAIANKQIGQEIDTGDLPGLLTAKYNQFNANTVVPSMKDIDQSVRVQSMQLKNNKNLFWQNKLNPAIDDTAQHIATNYRPIVNAAYNQYRGAQNQIEDLISNSGQQLQSSDISDNLINKTIGDAIRQGVPEAQLGKLTQIGKALEGQEGSIVDLMGKPMDISNPIPFSQIKGNVGYLLKNLPDKAKYALVDNWQSYLKQYAPEGATQILDDINSKYSQFAPARNALYDLMDRDSGKFDTRLLSDRLRAFVKTGNDAGLTDLLGAFSKGTPLTPPMPGLADKVNGLQGLKANLGDYDTQLLNLAKHKQAVVAGAGQIKQQLQQGLQQHAALMNQTQTLLSQKNAIMQKYPIRAMITGAPKTIVKNLVGKAIGLGGKFAIGIPYGAVSGEIMNRAAGVDPAEGFKAWYIGQFGSQQDKQNAMDQLQMSYQSAMQT